MKNVLNAQNRWASCKNIYYDAKINWTNGMLNSVELALFRLRQQLFSTIHIRLKIEIQIKTH